MMIVKYFAFSLASMQEIRYNKLLVFAGFTVIGGVLNGKKGT